MYHGANQSWKMFEAKEKFDVVAHRYHDLILVFLRVWVALAGISILLWVYVRVLLHSIRRQIAAEWAHADLSSDHRDETISFRLLRLRVRLENRSETAVVFVIGNVTAQCY
eukprot:m.914386 g.914386  ORF g.914386 m.914386 type:complete len:111 (-) comp23730_c0_seq17:2248-2580(-)